jgi:cyclic di-GMP phosphodiesterase
VIAQSKSRRLKPKVMMVLNAQKNLLSEFSTLDLFSESSKHVEIVKSLEPGAYGIDPDKLFL